MWSESAASSSSSSYKDREPARRWAAVGGRVEAPEEEAAERIQPRCVGADLHA